MTCFHFYAILYSVGGIFFSILIVICFEKLFIAIFNDKSPTKQFYNLCSAGFLPIISMKNCYVFFLYPISFLQIESQTSLLYWNHMMLSIYLSLFAEKNESIVLIFKTIKEVFSTVWSFSKLNSVFLLLYIIGYFFDMFY